jgi:hypothetical protein
MEKAAPSYAQGLENEPRVPDQEPDQKSYHQNQNDPHNFEGIAHGISNQPIAGKRPRS